MRDSGEVWPGAPRLIEFAECHYEDQAVRVIKILHPLAPLHALPAHVIDCELLPFELEILGDDAARADARVELRSAPCF